MNLLQVAARNWFVFGLAEMYKAEIVHSVRLQRHRRPLIVAALCIAHAATGKTPHTKVKARVAHTACRIERNVDPGRLSMMIVIIHLNSSRERPDNRCSSSPWPSTSHDQGRQPKTEKIYFLRCNAAVRLIIQILVSLILIKYKLLHILIWWSMCHPNRMCMVPLHKGQL